MAKIKVKYGTVGFYAGGRHKTKTTADAPFEVEDAQAAHLVKAGVVEYVTMQQHDEDETHETDTESGETPETAHLAKSQLEEMTIQQLQNLAGDLGVDTTSCKKKADYVEAIAAVEVIPGPEVDGDDDMPELGAADPE